MNRTKLAPCLAAAMLLCSNVKAADLLDVLDLAFENDAGLNASRIAAEADAMLPGIARTALYPSISAIAIEKRERKPAATIRQTDGEIMIRQPVWNFGLGAGIAAAESSSRVGSFQLRLAEQDLYSKVAERYFRVLAAEDNLETVESEVAAIQEFYDLALDRLEVGLGTRTDLNDAAARLSQVNATEVEARHEILLANLALAEIAGIEVGNLSKLSPNARIANPQPDDKQWWVDLALENSVEIALAEERSEGASIQIQIESSKSKPHFDLRLSHRSSLSGDDDTTDQDLASLVATIPLYAGGVVQKRTRQARTIHRARLEQLEATRRMVINEASGAYLDVVRSVSEVAAYEDALVASNSALQARVDGYEAGIFTTSDVLNSQRDVFAVERDLNRAKYSHFLSIVKLQRVTGRLDRSHFESLNNALVR